MPNIHYRITSKNPFSHIFDVELNIKHANPEGQKLRLPAWIPGSYMIRDFAKNIIDINASSAQQNIPLTQIDKSTWQCAPFDAIHELTINYRVYAWDLSVRSAHLDQTHGFFNGTSVFLEVLQQTDDPCLVTINKPKQAECNTWQCATSLQKQQVNSDGFGDYLAANYNDLIDHPVEMAAFKKLSFNTCGVTHDIILTGQFDCDEQRLCHDLSLICKQHIRFFGEPAPIRHYVFLIMVVGDGYGGLEHRSSTSLLISRKDLPQTGQSEMTDDYRSFLGLCSHEYFHTWNVKRMKPAAFLNTDLTQETYTPLLWAFEGITSYYDDLALLRCGLIDETAYLELLAQTITRVLKTRGRLIQSIAESSFNAWTKFYKQDENAQNAIVSYYAKGTLVALCLDLTIRHDSQNQYTLDDVMRHLWQDYLNGNAGFQDNSIQLTMEQLLGRSYTDLFQHFIYSVDELPLNTLLHNVNIALKTYPPATQDDKGGKTISTPAKSDFGAFLKQQGDFLHILRVNENGPAQLAGLSAGDHIVAVNHLKLDIQQFNKLLSIKEPQTKLTISAFRRDELMNFNVTLGIPKATIAVLSRQNPTSNTTWPYAQTT